MATYFVSSSGSNTAPYDTWAKAATSIQTALSAATSSGDVIVIQYNAVPSADAEVSAATTYIAAANIKIISATNNGGTSFTPNVMGTGSWLGNSTTSRSLTVSGAFNVYIYGVTFRTAAVSTSTLVFGATSDMQLTMDSCYIWQGNTSSSQVIRFGPGGTNSANTFVKVRKCTFRFGNVGQSIRVAASLEVEDCSISSSGSAITDIWCGSESTDPAGSSFTAIGCDFSAAATGANIVGDTTRPILEFKFVQCKLPASYVALGTQTVPNKSAARVWLFDCASGDTHGILEYSDGLGSMVMDTGIYYTTTPSLASWKIVTNSYCSDNSPFETPWIDQYNTSFSAVTPRIEILRDGSATAYTNAEVWGEFFVKDTSGTSKSTFYTDKVDLMGTPSNQATGAGTGSWTGEGTAWSGKVDIGGITVTPAEVGMVRGRVCVGIPSATVYVEPYIRT